MKKCDCDERIGININTIKEYEALKSFFDEQVEKGIFIEIPVEKPHYVGNDMKGNAVEWYANEWYRCCECGTIWEFDYPDFPAKGFVRKINA